MDAQIVVRLPSDLKDKFFDIAEKKGVGASNVIREWISEYVKEYDENDEVEIMVKAGKELQKKLGGFKKSQFHGGTLNRALKNNVDKFIHEVTALHAQYEIHIPTQLLNVRDNPNLGYAYVIGLLSVD